MVPDACDIAVGLALLDVAEDTVRGLPGEGTLELRALVSPFPQDQHLGHTSAEGHADKRREQAKRVGSLEHGTQERMGESFGPLLQVPPVDVVGHHASGDQVVHRVKGVPQGFLYCVRDLIHRRGRIVQHEGKLALVFSPKP